MNHPGAAQALLLLAVGTVFAAWPTEALWPVLAAACCGVAALRILEDMHQ